MPTTLSGGGAAIVGYNTGQSDGSGNPATLDSIQIVLLEPIDAGTTIYITDRAWNGSAFTAGANDGTITYTASAGQAAGTVIDLPIAGGFNPEESGDTVYVYQGSGADSPTSFLFAIEIGDGNTTFNGNLTGTGLVNGISAVAVGLDSGAYSGPTTQQQSYLVNGTDLLHSISDANNWAGDNRDTFNAKVQPVQTNFLVSPDIQIWGATAGGSGDGIVSVGADSTTGGLAVGINQVRYYNSDGDADESAAFINLTVAPRDLVIDTVHGKFFLADSDLAGTNRILQGNLSDLLGSPGTVPTVTVLYSDATSGVNSQIRNLVIDPDNGQVFFSHGGTTSVQRINYDTAGQTPVTLVNLGAGNPNGNSNNFVDDFVINFDTGHIYITSHRVTAAADGDILSRNFIYDASGLTSSSSSALSYTNLPFSPDDTAGGFFQVPGEAFPHELGSLEGIALSADGNTIYFATATLTEDTDGDGDTGDVVLRPGGIFSYALTGNAAGTYTTIFTQTIGGAGPQGLLDELEIDTVTGRWYVSDTTGGTAQAGDEGIWTGLLSGGGATKFATIANNNGGAIDGFQLNRAPTLTLGSTGGTYTETAGASSGFGTAVVAGSGATVGDADTTGLNDQMAGATVRIATGFLSGAGHQDRLTINGTTSGTASGITYSYDSATGVMTLTGATTFANYQTVLNLVAYSVSGDNPTNYGADTSRTIAWSVNDGLVSSDEQTTTVTVTGVNDAPVVTVPALGYTVTEQTQLDLKNTGLSVSDPDAGGADITVTLAVSAGTISIDPHTSGVGVTNDGTSSVTLTGTVDEINNLFGPLGGLGGQSSISYNNNSNIGGSVTLTLTADDQGATGGTSLQDSDSATITITPVNDSPVLDSLGGTVTTDEQTAVVLDTDALIADVDLDPLNGGSGDYHGASLTVARQGGADAQDDFGFDLTGALFTVDGNNIRSGGFVFAHFSDGGGTLTINFESLVTTSTSALVDNVLQHITYTNTSDTPPTTVLIDYSFNDGSPGNGQGSGAPATATGSTSVTITPVDDPGVANDDLFVTDEATALVAGNVFANNGFGADSDPDSALAVTKINGVSGVVGTQVTLASGALLTLNANGTFDYDPNGAFDDLPDSASGAINLLRDDSFTYTLADGDTATVTITVAGLDSDGDILRGTKGVDNIFAGGIGSDLYFIDDAGDTIVETAGNGAADRVASFVSFTLAADDDIEILSTNSSTGKAAIDLRGNALSQAIIGNDGKNVLNDGGVGGADTMRGHDGNDTYLVYNSGDVVIELDGEGNDRVSAGVDYTLGKGVHVELLNTSSASATLAIDLTGNAFAQTIRGNAGDNVLSDGGTGAADTLIGGKGNDDFQVYNSGDVIVELDGEGADRVSAAVDFVLAAGVHVEYLNTTALAATYAISLTGNELVQLVRGNDGVNTIDGGGGDDVLFGMGGADNFRFSTALAPDNIARIADFAAGSDKIHLDDAIFTALGALGALDPAAFRDTATGVKDADDRIIYNSDTGALAYDADGSGTAFANIRFATITGSPLLTAADFVVI